MLREGRDNNIVEEALANLVVNKLRGAWHINALEAPGFGEQKVHILTTLLLSLESLLLIRYYQIALSRAFRHAAKIDLIMESTTIVGDVLYMEANSEAVKRMIWNDAIATELAPEAAEYVLIPKLMTLYANLEEKGYFRVQRI